MSACFVAVVIEERLCIQQCEGEVGMQDCELVYKSREER